MSKYPMCVECKSFREDKSDPWVKYFYCDEEGQIIEPDNDAPSCFRPKEDFKPVCLQCHNFRYGKLLRMKHPLDNCYCREAGYMKVRWNQEVPEFCLKNNLFQEEDEL